MAMVSMHLKSALLLYSIMDSSGRGSAVAGGFGCRGL